MEDDQQNFPQIMDCPYPIIPHQTQMLLGQSSGQEQDLEGPSVDPFMIPDLDDPYEQEKLKKGLSGQLSDAKTQ